MARTVFELKSVRIQTYFRIAILYNHCAKLHGVYVHWFTHSLIDSFIHSDCSVDTTVAGHQTQPRTAVRRLLQGNNLDQGLEMERSGLVSDIILRYNYVAD